MTPIPRLSKDEQVELAKRLVKFGLLRRDREGRFWITGEGHCAGILLYCIAGREHDEQEAEAGELVSLH